MKDEEERLERESGPLKLLTEQDYLPSAALVESSKSFTIRLSGLDHRTIRWLGKSLFQNHWLKSQACRFFPRLLRKMVYRPRPAFVISLSRVRVKIDRDKASRFRIRYFSENGSFVGPLQNKTLRRNLKTVASRPPKDWIPQEPKPFGPLVPLAGRADHNFGHFMLEYLPRLRMVEKHLGSLNEVTVLLSSQEQWKMELLQRVGIRADQVFLGTSDFLASQLLITDNSPVYMRDFEFKLENVLWLREKLTPSSNAIAPRKIVYLRRDGNRRQVPREAEDLLEEYGVATVSPGSLSLEEKQAVLASAHTVIGGVGSNLVNILLAPHHPNTLVISDSNFPPHLFHTLLELSGFAVTHLHFSLSTAGELEPNAPTKVNIQNLRRELNKILA